MACVNKSLPAYKELAAEFGDSVAESLVIANKYVVPDITTAIQIIRGTKVKQFTQAVRHAQNLTSPIVDDLMKGFNGIVKKVGDAYYLVSGTRISERPPMLAQAEIENPNRSFINQFNDQVAPIFSVEVVSDVIFSQEAVDIVAKNDSTISGMYKDFSKADPVTFLNEVAKQALNLVGGEVHSPTAEDISRYGNSAEDYTQFAMIRAKEMFGENLVNDAVRFYNSENALAENKTKATQGFFSDVVTGKSDKFKAKAPWKSILSFSESEEAFKKVYDTFKGNFDEHIATSIPTFRELQIKVGATLTDMYQGGGLIYDIGGSEGGFIKAITKESNGQIKSINLDVNEDMQAVHNAKPVEGSTFVNEAFLEAYTDEYPVNDELQHVFGNKLPQLILTVDDLRVDPTAKDRLLRISSELSDSTGTVAVNDIRDAAQAVADNTTDETVNAFKEIVKKELSAINALPVTKTYPRHVPKEKADVVHESMVFQFISPERKQFIGEIKKNYIKPDGIVLLEEKVLPASEAQWLQNEKIKDSYKLQYYPQEAITAKAEQVLVGMKANQTAEADLVSHLKSNFKFVSPYWDAGNFKGYIATDSKEKHDEFLSKLGGMVTSQYSSVKKFTDEEKMQIYKDLQKYVELSNAKKFVNISDFISEFLPAQYADKYKNLYKLAKENKIVVDIRNGILQGQESLGSWGNGSINIDPTVVYRSFESWDEFAEVLNHEIIHGLMSRALNSGMSNREFKLHTELSPIFKNIVANFDNASDNVKEIIAYIIDSSRQFDVKDFSLETIDQDILPSTENLEELITYSFTNEEFAKFLDTIPSINNSSAKTRRTLWDDLVQIIRNFISSISNKTALDDVTDIMNKFFNITANESLLDKPIAGKKVTRTNSGNNFKFALDAVVGKRKEDGAQLTINDAGYYQSIVDEGGHLFIAEDGSFGAFVTADGYMGSMFKDPDVEGKVSKDLQALRIEFGGRYMDAYSTLEPLYVKNGFRPVARLAFDESVAPENWSNTSLKDKPDVVFFSYDPNGEYTVGDGEVVTSYEQGLSVAAAYSVPVNASEQKVAPGNMKVVVNEQALSEFTKANQENRPDEDTMGKDEPAETDSDLQKLGNEYWTREQKTRFVVNNSIAMLSRKFGIKVKIVNDPNTFWRGKFSNGIVTLNEAYMTPDTPFHEMFHAIFQVLQQENPSLYNKLLDEVRTTEEGERVFQEVQRKYPELSAKDQLDEAAVQLLGVMSGTKALQDKSLWKQFFEWLQSVVARMGIFVKDFRSDMSLAEVSDLILDPSFVMDLKRKNDFENTAERYSKVDPELMFDEVMDRIIKRLQTDINIPAKTSTESTRKYFSQKQLEAFQKNRKDIKAIDGFVLSALSQTKEITAKFEKFKALYDKQSKKTPADIKEMSNLLYEIENVLVLYDDLRPLINSMKEVFPDDADNYGSLFNYLSRQDELIQGYRDYGLDIVAEWLLPYMKKGINGAKASGKLNKVVSQETFDEVNKTMRASGVTDPDTILNEAVKKELKKTIMEAKSDYQGFIGWFDLGLSGTTSSKDAVTQLVGISMVEEVQKALKKALAVKDEIKKSLRKVRGNSAFVTDAAEKEFYSKYLRQADSYEYQGLDENGDEKYDYVKRWAFHEKYLMDVFYNAKREFMEKLGPRPPKDDPKAKAWDDKRKAWFDANATTVTDNQGKVKYLPNAKYLNPQFDAMMNDELYRTLYNAYKNANDKLGFQGLKYGIIPQQSKGKNLFSNVRNKGGIKGGLKEVAKNLREGIGANEQMYFAENIEGFERKTVPINYISLLEEEDLSFNLADSVNRFSTSAFKYEALRGVEPQVMVLRNFINGNAYLSLNPRKAQQTTAKGLAKLKKGSREVLSVEATRLNEQLNSFINDIMYGETDERQLVKLWGSKFVVYKKDDVSNNGKPLKEVIKNFEDLRQKVERPNLNYSDFKPGEEQEINGYVVKLANKDWNISLNKAGNTAGIITALQNMALNVNSLVMNVGIGNISSFVESSGGKYFSMKDWASAQKEYWKHVFSGSFFEDTRGGKQSKIGQFLTHYDAFQGEFEDELGKKITSGVANRLLRRDRLFLFQRVGEHQIQSVGMISMMKAQKVPTKSGAKLSLYDAWDTDVDGNIKLKDDAIWSEEDDLAFRNTLQGVNKELNGNYSKLDKAKLQRIWWGRALIMFRKHIYNAFKARYGKEEINYERGTVTEGYYRTFWNMILDELSSYTLNRKFRKMNDQEKYAMRKLAADLGIVLSLFALFKATDDDDEDNEFSDNVAFWSRRLLSDTGQYTPVIGWMELSKIVRDPAASVNTVDKYYQALSQLIKGPDEVYERDGPGYTKGELKWKVKMGKIVPVYRQWLNAQNPEDMLKFYKLNVKSLISAGSEKKNEQENNPSDQE